MSEKFAYAKIDLTLTRVEALAVAFALEQSAQEHREARHRWRAALHARVAEEMTAAASAGVSASELAEIKRHARACPTPRKRNAA